MYTAAIQFALTYAVETMCMLVNKKHKKVRRGIERRAIDPNKSLDGEYRKWRIFSTKRYKV